MLLSACLEPNPNADAADEVGTSDASTGTDAGTTDGGNSNGGTTVETTAGTTDGGTTDGGTTDSPVCGDIVDIDECAATDGCQPVTGFRLKDKGPNSPCLLGEEFLGCIPAQACDAVISWFCQGNESYQVADSCGAEGFAPCDGPVDPLDACP